MQTNEEATVYVYDLDLFVTVQILEDTPDVISLGKLYKDHGYSYEWTSGQKPHHIKNGRKSNATRKTMYRSLSQDYHKFFSTSLTPDKDENADMFSEKISPAAIILVYFYYLH